MSKIIIPSAFQKNEEVAQTFSSTPMLKKLIKIVKEIEAKDPIKKMLRDNGFSPENGDLIVLPDTWKIKDVKHPNLVFSAFTDKPFMLKKPNLFSSGV